MSKIKTQAENTIYNQIQERLHSHPEEIEHIREILGDKTIVI